MVGATTSASAQIKIGLLEPVLLVICGLLYQTLWLLFSDIPRYYDSYYYASTGKILALGGGFTDQAIFSYLYRPAQLIHPSHEYWMPFPSVLASIGYLLRNDYIGMSMPFAGINGLIPAICYYAAAKLGCGPNGRRIAALIAISGGVILNRAAQPSSLAPFCLLGALVLILMASPISSNGGKKFFGIGLLVGLLHLTRSDGMLFALTGSFVYLTARFKGKPGIFHRYRCFLLFIGGYLFLIIPWFVRQYLVFGTLLPSSAATSLSLGDFSEIFSWFEKSGGAGEFTPSVLIGMISRSFRLAPAILWSFISSSTLFILLPLALFELYRLKRENLGTIKPFVVYSLLSLGFYIGFLPQFAVRGSIMQSTIALWPITVILSARAVEGFERFCSVRVSIPIRTLIRSSLLIIVLSSCHLISIAGALYPAYRLSSDHYREICSAFAAEDIVMTLQPHPVQFECGVKAVMAPCDSLAAAEAVIARYGITDLLLEDDGWSYWRDLYKKRVQPEWLDRRPRIQTSTLILASVHRN